MTKRLTRIGVTIHSPGGGPGHREPSGFHRHREPVGYYRLIGCTGRDENDVRIQIDELVSEDHGASIFEFEDYGEVKLIELADFILETMSGNPDERGMWYLGGKALYLNEEC